MKLLPVLVVSAVAGGGLGAALAFWSVGPAAPAGVAVRTASVLPDKPDKPGDQPPIEGPNAVVDQPRYVFGTMLRGTAASHEFVVRNDGSAPLRLTVGRTTCKCTLGEVSGDAIPPGESTPIRVEWTAKTLPGPFRQTATINTNDLRRPTIELVVEGTVTEVSGLVPNAFDLGVVDVDTGGAASAFLMAFDQDDLQVSAKMSDTTLTPERFQLSVEPIDGTTELQEGVKAAVKLTLTADAGLPLGSVNEWVTVTTNLAGRESFVMPIVGRVRGAITIHGRGWNRETDLLNLGPINGAVGHESTLLLTCRGPLAESVEFEVESVDPPELLAEVGERRVLSSGVSHTRLRVAIPAGTRPMVRMKRLGDDGAADTGDGDALIRLRTNHPESSEINLAVRFVVQG